MRLRQYILFIAFCLMQTSLGFTQNIGPKNGSLVIAGGGSPEPWLMQRILELAGGPQALIVIIPTSSSSNNIGSAYQGKAYKLFMDQGATNLTVIHTSDRDRANSDVFVQSIREAQGVWFGGGRQWRTADAYLGTKTEEALWELLDRGGVISGSSAGATIQGSYLARGDTKNNQIMMGDHEEGFGFLKNVAIDQHTLTRNRHFDMFDILKNRPELLGISIDENTAIIVKGNEFEVIGESYVLIYDGTFWSREGSELKTLPEKDGLFYFLRKGDRYDLLNRQVIK
jgi:cyanophycinase